MVWILNGAHRTPVYRLLGLAKQACPHVLDEEDVDPDDPDMVTIPLMYEAGTYFVCDVVSDTRTNVYRIPHSKAFDQQLILQAYEKGTMNELRHILGVGDVETGQRQRHTDRTSNRSSCQTMDVRHLRPQDRPLPALGHRLDGLLLPKPQPPRGPDVDYFHLHGGGNRPLEARDDDPEFIVDPQNPLKNEVQVILEQMFFDILQESPNKKSHREGAWTNIPREFRHQLGIEDLYLHIEFPFHAIQYTISSPDNWAMHFDRFFPPAVPQRSGQNFGKARYYHSYLNLIRNLSRQKLSGVRCELRRKFNTLAWVPYTESDRMWCTKKMASSKWQSLPTGRMEGPKIAINLLMFSHLGGRPTLRLPPRPEELELEGQQPRPGQQAGEGDEGDAVEDVYVT